MKKVKIMLASLALVAVLGGTLAFKAIYRETYCTAPLPAIGTCPDTFCPDLTINSTTTTIGNFICTTTPIQGECQDELPCFTSTKLKINL